MNVKVTSSGIDPNLIIFGFVSGVITRGNLPLYASSATEVQFFALNRAKSVNIALLLAEQGGYNSGSSLIGLTVL